MLQEHPDPKTFSEWLTRDRTAAAQAARAAIARRQDPASPARCASAAEDAVKARVNATPPAAAAIMDVQQARPQVAGDQLADTTHVASPTGVYYSLPLVRRCTSKRWVHLGHGRAVTQYHGYLCKEAV